MKFSLVCIAYLFSGSAYGLDSLVCSTQDSAALSKNVTIEGLRPFNAPVPTTVRISGEGWQGTPITFSLEKQVNSQDAKYKIDDKGTSVLGFINPAGNRLI
jgi:hypothetical protein